MAFKNVTIGKRLYPVKETLKLNEEVPFLGISNDETRDSTGQLLIRLISPTGQKGWVVVGKYAEPRADGNQFYVADKRHGYLRTHSTTYHEDLLMAVTRVVQLKEEFE